MNDKVLFMLIHLTLIDMVLSMLCCTEKTELKFKTVSPFSHEEPVSWFDLITRQCAVKSLSLSPCVWKKKKMWQMCKPLHLLGCLSLWVYCPLKLEFVYNASTNAVQSHKTPQQCSQNGLFWLMISSQWKMPGSRGSCTERKKNIQGNAAVWLTVIKLCSHGKSV